MDYKDVLSHSMEDLTGDGSPDEEFHFLPDEDCFNHEHSYLCPCQPKKIISIFGEEIWMHNKIVEQRN